MNAAMGREAGYAEDAAGTDEATATVRGEDTGSARPAMGEDAGSDGVWRWSRATRAHAVIDAEPFFELIRESMLGAKQRIMLIGWDFDTRVMIGGRRKLRQMRDREIPPGRLGPFMIWLANRTPGLEIRILKWNFGAMKAVLRGRMMLDLLRWWRHPQITFKLDSAHPLGCSHHQKIVVIDDCMAACGGIDMTSGRWDTREHLEKDARRKMPDGGLYGPWHDCTMLLEGPIAGELAQLGRDRWVQAGGSPLAPCKPQDETAWPERLKPQFRNVDIGISRTRSQWSHHAEVREVEDLFLAQIARAKRFIYAENQYFASRRIAEAIADRLDEPDPPEFVLVEPLNSDGWLQQQAMDTARVRLIAALGLRDHAKRFTVWTPYNASGTPIYVHSKLTIVDDEVLRIGSANMNNRSLGLDSECDVHLDAVREGDDAVRDTIRALRISLLAEHCGVPVDEMTRALDSAPSMSAALAGFATTRVGRKSLRLLPLRELTEAERALADSEVLDPERPEEMLSFYHKGLFGGRLRDTARRLRTRMNRGMRRDHGA